jgi:putative spermidine/putrescine transport system substrate-binding protein
VKKLSKGIALLLTLGLAATSIAGCSSKSTSSAAKEKTLVVVTWGGALESAIKESVSGFEKDNNCKIQWESPTDYAKVKSMVQSGNVQWDVITCDSYFIPKGGSEGLLEPIDYSIVDKTDLDSKYISEYGVGSYTWSTVIGYNTDKYTSTTSPQSWAEFWDTSKYSGKRTLYKSPIATLEVALLADGVKKDNLYPLDIDRALKSLDKIKSKIKTWWEDGAQPQQLLASKDVDLAEAWAGRITSAQKEGAHVDINFNQAIVATDQWGVVKGTKEKTLAMKFINAVTGAKAQAKFSETVPYGPVNTDAYKLLSKKTIDSIPSAPEYANQVIYLDGNYWAENFDSVNEKFQSWLLD